MNSPSARSDDDQPLDAELLAALAAEQEPEPVDARLAGRVKRKLLARIAEAERGHLTVHGDGHAPATPDEETPGWQPFLSGIEIKVLHEREGVMSYLLRFAPGAVLPPHRHPVDEECVVLEGALQIGKHLTVHAGGFHLARKDALHAPIATLDGAVIYLRGAIPEADQLL